MRILLINPYYPISETPSPPLGLAYLAAALCEAGAEVQILDLVVYPYSRPMLQNLLNTFDPQIAGITSVTMTFDNAIEVLRDLKHINPEILTVMGGPHVSFCASNTLADHPELDIIVLGEGERTMVDLMQTAQNGAAWDQIKGIAYRNGSDICQTAKRDLIPNLDTLPHPARQLLPLGRYRALGMPISMTTSRGCPFKCIFCVGRKMVGDKVRYRSAENVFKELKHLSRLDFHQINIADDLFTANKSHCMAVCDEIIKNDLKITWTSFARVDTVSYELLVKMKAAGCSAVSFGIESANAEILKTIKKSITREQVVNAVHMCNRAGITPYASFILGLPGETPDTIKETIDFGHQLKDLGLSFGFHLLAPFPGTEVRDNHFNFGINILTHDWRRYHANRAIIETPEVKREMLDRLVIEWEDEYNHYLADIKTRMQQGNATPQEADQVINLERIVLIYELMMKNVIEREGSWSLENRRLTQKEHLKRLSNRISHLTDSTSDALYSTLSYSLQQGNLEYSIAKGSIQWNWVDFLE
ncbi:MAG: radical SAM protein [Desulfobacterales bacterium]|jgi:radical SAM superfamily enzyme YgiQ (UPF0313 family)